MYIHIFCILCSFYLLLENLLFYYFSCTVRSVFNCKCMQCYVVLKLFDQGKGIRKDRLTLHVSLMFSIWQLFVAVFLFLSTNHNWGYTFFLGNSIFDLRLGVAYLPILENGLETELSYLQKHVLITPPLSQNFHLVPKYHLSMRNQVIHKKLLRI